MNTRARIATICQSGHFYPTVEENRAAVMRRLAIALRHKPDLVCLPETFSTAALPGNAASLAETIPGPTLDRIASQARQHHCYIICPLLTHREGLFWNSAVVIDRAGHILGVYDKLHPVTTTSDYTQMEGGITPASNIPVFDLDFGRIGIQICFDIQFPESWAALAEQGAKAIFWPSAYNGGFPLQTYAWLHHTYVISSVNTEKARIIDPLGKILAETEYQLNVLVRDINLDYAVCHYDFNYSVPDRIQTAYPGQVEVRSDWDSNHFLVEPLDPKLTIARLQSEFGFNTVQEYVRLHQNAYASLRAGKAPVAQLAAHGRRPMFCKENTISILPEPTRITSTEGSFAITAATHILVSPEARGVGEYLQGLLPFPLNLDQVQDDLPHADGILLSTTGAVASLGNEGYQLSVSPAGVIVRANQPAGLFYGVQTLRQLITPDKNIPAVEISDQPRFPWRGLMLDVGRHVFPLGFIFRWIDTMALHKLNVLHWHLTEDQGWRIEIKKYPILTEVGSNRSASPLPAERDRLDGVPYGGYYTQEQVRQVVAYAASRFITVVPEIEMPGHSVAALASYPELGCTGGPYAVRTFWGIEDDVYCAGNEQTFTFLQDVLDEVLALFPSEFIHIGGDECPKVRWQACPKCQEAIHQNGLKDEHELQSYFIRRIEAHLNHRGRRLIGWDEILEGGLAPNASVMSWRGIQGGLQAVREGHDVVMTPTDFCYLDYYQSQDIAHEPTSIGGFLPLEKAYAFEPVPAELSPDEARHILGAQGNLWSEYIPTPEQAEYMLFPRLSALAEVVWSEAKRRDFVGFQQRLSIFMTHLKKMGMNYRSDL